MIKNQNEEGGRGGTEAPEAWGAQAADAQADAAPAGMAQGAREAAPGRFCQGGLTAGALIPLIPPAIFNPP